MTATKRTNPVLNQTWTHTNVILLNRLNNCTQPQVPSNFLATQRVTLAWALLPKNWAGARVNHIYMMKMGKHICGFKLVAFILLNSFHCSVLPCQAQDIACSCAVTHQVLDCSACPHNTTVIDVSRRNISQISPGT